MPAKFSAGILLTIKKDLFNNKFLICLITGFKVGKQNKIHS